MIPPCLTFEKNFFRKIRGIDWFRPPCSDPIRFVCLSCSMQSAASGAVCFGLFSKQTQLNLNKYLNCRDCLTWIGDVKTKIQFDDLKIRNDVKNFQFSLES